jgi:hypothetical protein
MVKKDEMSEHVACTEEVRSTHKTLVGNPSEKKPVRRTRRRWKYNNEMDFRDMGYEGVDWIHLS